MIRTDSQPSPQAGDPLRVRLILGGTFRQQLHLVGLAQLRVLRSHRLGSKAPGEGSNPRVAMRKTDEPEPGIFLRVANAHGEAMA